MGVSVTRRIVKLVLVVPAGMLVLIGPLSGCGDDSNSAPACTPEALEDPDFHCDDDQNF